MNAICMDRSFINSVAKAKQMIKDGFKVEPIVVDHVPLKHNTITGIVIGGLGPDVLAPCAYRPWSKSDFAGGVYVFKNRPHWYISDAFRSRVLELKITDLIRQCFGEQIDYSDASQILRVVWHIAC